jgi:hypothetical protein
LRCEKKTSDKIKSFPQTHQNSTCSTLNKVNLLCKKKKESVMMGSKEEKECQSYNEIQTTKKGSPSGGTESVRSNIFLQKIKNYNKCTYNQYNYKFTAYKFFNDEQK